MHKATSIKVAEAAKVIENTQRDLNIALMNELALIFHRMGIDTLEVLQAAGTKWNFLPFRPGLVGGHCIGVDPYYLTHKADMLGYHPQVILAGRRINDGMGAYVAQQTVKQMIANGVQVKGAKVNVLGLTFKENCPDLRNSKVVDVVRELQSFGCEVHVHDPLGEPTRGRARIRHQPDRMGRLARNATPSSPPWRTSAYLEKPFGELTARLKKGGVFTDVKCGPRSGHGGGRGLQALEAVMSRYRDAAERCKRQPKTWLITGAAGFIGCNLVEALLNLDQRVVGLDNFATGHEKNLDQVRDSVGRRADGKISASSSVTSARWTIAARPVAGRGLRAASGGARFRAALDRGPAAHQCLPTSQAS